MNNKDKVIEQAKKQAMLVREPHYIYLISGKYVCSKVNILRGNKVGMALADGSYMSVRKMRGTGELKPA